LLGGRGGGVRAPLSPPYCSRSRALGFAGRGECCLACCRPRAGSAGGQRAEPLGPAARTPMSDADPNPRRLLLPVALCASVLVAPLLLHRPGGARVAHSASRPARVTAGRDSHAASSAASRSDAAPMTADQLAALESAAGTVSAQAASRAVPTADVGSTDTLAGTTTTLAVAPARPEVRAA